VDDFYIYYEPVSDAHQTGVIKAISPTKLSQMGDMEFIRVSDEVGLAFAKGNKSLNGWIIKWNPDSGTMQLTQRVDSRVATEINFLKQIPTRQTKPQVIVTWLRGDKKFNVRVRGVSISQPDRTMLFFVTRRNDPNIIFHNFRVALVDTMNRKGYDIMCDADIPDQFSVYARFDFTRYQLRIEK
jgi:hypothetical protein